MIGSDDFITGTDSPVSIDSFTIAFPVNKTKSQGRLVDSGTTTTSPGSNYELSTSSSFEPPFPSDILNLT